MKKVFIFDFDGVLAVPWSNPEQHYPQIPEIVEKFSKDHLLCVASFNPRAQIAIESWKLDHLFTAVRCGANIKWTGEYTNDYRTNMSKADQISNMILNEIYEHPSSYEEIIFYDDDPDNIEKVQKQLPHVKSIL